MKYGPKFRWNAPLLPYTIRVGDLMVSPNTVVQDHNAIQDSSTVCSWCFRPVKNMVVKMDQYGSFSEARGND